MYIVIHCGGMPFNGGTIKTESLGGSESAAYYMAKELVEAGHSVTLFTNSKDGGMFDGVKYVHAGNVTQQTPLGDAFELYAMNTPHDVCIIQRALDAFTRRFASKVNLLWMHDLALLRYKQAFGNQLWNVDGVLTVSEFHAKQIKQVYGVDDRLLMPIQNGVDVDLFDEAESTGATGFNLLYSSRPERGLENLVAPGGIMERLLEIDPTIKLHVCTYNNVAPHMEIYYKQLWQRCAELPNVVNVGSLTKRQLAKLMVTSDLMVYPTEFEEVSCITAMECMAAGLPFISSDHAALTETCKGSGSVLLPLQDGHPSIDAFVAKIATLKADKAYMEKLVSKQYASRDRYKWVAAADMLLEHIEGIFQRTSKNKEALAKHLMRNSDIYALKKLIPELPKSAISDAINMELIECYGFMNEQVWDAHYQTYYEHEAAKGVNYGPEEMFGEPRFETVAGKLSELQDGDLVIDYGCAHGHYTVNLAKRYPNLMFIGVDIAQSNIDIAKKWATDDGVNNVSFIRGEWTSIQETGLVEGAASAVIMAEVLEHMARPELCVEKMQTYVKEDGLVICTTPSGPWEAIGYKKEWPWRAHVYHFERADIVSCYGKMKDFNILTIGHQLTPDGLLGNFVYSWHNTNALVPICDRDDKLTHQAPRETISLCMIIKDAAATIQRTLESAVGVVDEVVINLDLTTSDNTEAVIMSYMRDYWPEIPLSIFHSSSPLEIGFDEARNDNISRATGDWILWLDADELLHNTQSLKPFLRNNQYNGYAIKQHHFSMQPAGILKTDMPVRIFRNNVGIKFFGVVHEHPELELNKGVGQIQLLNDACIGHVSYMDEETRRNKFMRNITPLARDRKKYPDRVLGKFLWLRDLAQMTSFELEKNGGQITPVMKSRADEGISLWEDLIISGHTRMAVESLDYYSILNKVLGKGFDFGFRIDSQLHGDLHLERAGDVSAHFNSQEHVKLLFDKLMAERTDSYERPYQ